MLSAEDIVVNKKNVAHFHVVYSLVTRVDNIVNNYVENTKWQERQTV